MFPPRLKGWLGQEYCQKTIILDHRVIANGICVSGKDVQLQTQNIHNKFYEASQTQPTSKFHEQSVSGKESDEPSLLQKDFIRCNDHENVGLLTRKHQDTYVVSFWEVKQGEAERDTVAQDSPTKIRILSTVWRQVSLAKICWWELFQHRCQK